MNTLDRVHEILYVPSIIDGFKTREIRENWEKVSNSGNAFQKILCVSKCSVNDVVTNKLWADKAGNADTNVWSRALYTRMWITPTDL